jgi:16S rRNA C967 or C1407 C5-methylase (RsmB/RsmF family)
MLRPGGRLVYAVCTPMPEEGRDVVNAAIAAGGWRRVAVTRAEIAGFEDSLTADGDVLTLPRIHPSPDERGAGAAPVAESTHATMNSDAFYVARLERA